VNIKKNLYILLIAAFFQAANANDPLTTIDVVGMEHTNAGQSYDQRNLEKPVYLTMQVVLDNGRDRVVNGWADPEDYPSTPEFEGQTRKSFLGQIMFDKNGRPINPMGNTGINGRGWLGKWGVNLAADPVITRTNAETGGLEMLAIRRRDNGMWAIPGGMVDDGDSVSATLAKEFKEEAGIKIPVDFMNRAETIYQGYSDDPRNTNNAWIETDARWKNLNKEIDIENVIAQMEPQAGDDAAQAKWQPLTEEFAENTYASHPAILREILRRAK
jgi:ADP-ribose pyrophosphatase